MTMRPEIPDDVLESVSIDALDAAIARASLNEFTRYTHPGYVDGWASDQLGDVLDRHLDDVIAKRSPRDLIMAPPRWGKTEKTSRRFPAYALGRYPHLDVLAASYSSTLATRNGRDVRRIMESEAYKRVFPTIEVADRFRRNADGKVSQSDFFELVGYPGSYRAAGVGQGITGTGADILDLDDLIKDRLAADSQVTRDGIWDWLMQVAYTRLSPGGGILLVTTRWHEDDPAGRMLEAAQSGTGEEWRVTMLQAIAEQDEPHRRAGEALHPERWSLERLKQIRKTIGEHAWASLYQQRPAPREGAMFQPSRVPVLDHLPARVIKTARGVDKGGTAGGGDPSAFALVGRLESNPVAEWAILDVECGQWDALEREARLLQAAQLDGPQSVIVQEQEPGSGGKESAQATTRNLSGYRVVTVPAASRGSKTLQAEPLSVQVGMGNVCALRRDWTRPTLDELGLFPHGKHDDRVDAISLAFNFLARARESWADLISMTG